MGQQCPFLSTAEEKVECFTECVFFEYEVAEGCPFKKIKGNKNLSIKEILNIDLNDKGDKVLETMEDYREGDSYLKKIYIKEYL